MGRRREVSDEKIACALIEARGNVTAAAALLGIAQPSLWARVRDSEKLGKVRDAARLARLAAFVDLAEDGLGAALSERQRWAILRVLDTEEGARRGFAELNKAPAVVQQSRLEVVWPDEILGRVSGVRQVTETFVELPEGPKSGDLE